MIGTTVRTTKTGQTVFKVMEEKSPGSYRILALALLSMESDQNAGMVVTSDEIIPINIPACSFDIGDVVMLKSGGPHMTIVHTRPEYDLNATIVHVTWFNNNNDACDGELLDYTLQYTLDE